MVLKHVASLCVEAFLADKALFKAVIENISILLHFFKNCNPCENK